MCQCLSFPTSTPHVLSLLCIVPFEFTDAFLFPPEQSHWELAFLLLAVWELRPPCKRVSYNHSPCFSAGGSYKSLQGAHRHQAGRRLEALRPSPQTDACPRAPCPSPCAIHFGSRLSIKTMPRPGRLGVKISSMRQAAMRSSPCAMSWLRCQRGCPIQGRWESVMWWLGSVLWRWAGGLGCTTPHIHHGSCRLPPI